MAAIDEIRAAIERGDERAARATLRAQIARLEREHATRLAAAYPRLDPGPPAPALAGPRLLTLGELERVRDALAARVGHARAPPPSSRPRQAEAAARARADARRPAGPQMAAAPQPDLGLPGCTTYHVRPRAGLLGMLMGWWVVKISGGCP